MRSHIFSTFDTRVRIFALAAKDLVLPRGLLVQVGDPHVLLGGRSPDLRLRENGPVERPLHRDLVRPRHEAGRILKGQHVLDLCAVSPI